jgi:multidrug efflux pump subunit AcrA (membrane-fusion protein)
MLRPRIVLALLLCASLVACGSVGRTPTPLPTVVLDTGGDSPQLQGGVTASGVVVPAHEAELAFALAGIVQAVHVAVGDQVVAGQELAELENASFETALAQAQRSLRELTSPAAISAAEQAVVAARQSVDDAQKKVNALAYPRASESLIDNIEGQIELAREELAEASDDFRDVEGRAHDDPERAARLVAMTNAQMHLNQLIANINWYKGKPSDLDEAIAHANLDTATAELQEAEWHLAALSGEPIPTEATGGGLAELAQAEDVLATAQAELDSTRLASPFSGTVVAVRMVAGEYASPGDVLVVVNDLSRLLVETTDLSERDVPGVSLGQEAAVHIEALDQDVTGRVTSISQAAEILGGDVVYRTTLALESPPPGLRPGMSVEVHFAPTE